MTAPSHVFARSFARCDSDLRDALGALGMSDAAGFAAGTSGFAQSDFADLARSLLGPGRAQAAARALVALARETTYAGKRALNEIARAPTVQVGVYAAKRARMGSPKPLAWTRLQQRAPPATGTAPRWPRPRGGRALDGPASSGRKDAEDALRQKWLLAAVALAQEAGLPLVSLAEGAADPRGVLCSLGQGLRARTLQLKVRAMRSMVAYLKIAHGVPFPVGAAQVLDYLCARASEPCGSTVLQGALQALLFFERGGGVPPERQLGRHPAIVASAAELGLRLSAGAAGGKSAPRYPIQVVAAWEHYVLDVGRPTVRRAFAWWKAVKVWGTLRFDDHRGLAPQDVQYTPGFGLSGVLSRTKTTGKGKRVESLPLHVAEEAYLVRPEWLRTGFDLWEGFRTDRDFFLPSPSRDGEGFVDRELPYHLATAMSRALNWELANPNRPPESRQLLDEWVLPLWTEHSERHNLPSWVPCVLPEVPREWVDLLGRWSAKGGLGYSQTAKARVGRMQALTARGIREGRGGYDFLGEGDLLEEVQRYGREQGVETEVIRDQLDRLAYFGQDKRRPDPPPRAMILEGVPCTPAQPVRPAGLEPEECGVSDGNAGTTSFRLVARPDARGEDSGCAEGASSRALKTGPAVLEPTERALVPPDEEGFVVSVANSGHRKLHLLGACARVPGLHYHNFEYLGTELPPQDLYHSVCQHCWVKTQGVAFAGDENVSDEAESEDPDEEEVCDDGPKPGS